MGISIRGDRGWIPQISDKGDINANVPQLFSPKYPTRLLHYRYQVTNCMLVMLHQNLMLHVATTQTCPMQRVKPNSLCDCHSLLLSLSALLSAYYLSMSPRWQRLSICPCRCYACVNCQMQTALVQDLSVVISRQIFSATRITAWREGNTVQDLHQQLCIVLTTSPHADVAFRPLLHNVGIPVVTDEVGSLTEQLNRLLMAGNLSRPIALVPRGEFGPTATDHCIH